MNIAAIDGLKEHNFKKNPWTGVRRQMGFLLKQLTAAWTSHVKGDLSYLFDEEGYPMPFISDLALWHQRLDTEQQTRSMRTRIAEEAALHDWNATYGIYIGLIQRRLLMIDGAPPPDPQEAQQFMDIMATQPIVHDPVRHQALLTAAQAKEILDTPSKIKKFEEDATAAIQVVKDHISSHMQEEFSPIWDSTDVGQTKRRQIIATLAHLKRYQTESTASTLQEINDNFKDLKTICSFAEAVKTADMVESFQTELRFLSTPDHDVTKTDEELINIIVNKFDHTNPIFIHFRLQFHISGSMADKDIVARQYGEAATAQNMAGAPMTWPELKRKLATFGAQIEKPSQAQEHQVFSAQYLASTSSGQTPFVFAATQHGFSSPSSSNHHASQQVLDLQKDVQRMSHLLEQLSGRSSSPAGSRSGSPSRGSGTFVSSNSFVKPAGGGTSQPSSPVPNKRPRESRHPQSKSPRPRINQQSSQRTHTGYSAQHEVYESDWQYDSAHGPYLAAGDGSVWWGGPNSKGDGSDC